MSYCNLNKKHYSLISSVLIYSTKTLGQLFICTALSQAGGSGYCPLIFCYPLCFKSIVNYLHEWSSCPAREVDSTGQVEICLAEEFSVTQDESCPPTTATYWPISVSLGSWHSILLFAGSFFFFSGATFLLLTQPHTQQPKYSWTISLLLSC